MRRKSHYQKLFLITRMEDEHAISYDDYLEDSFNEGKSYSEYLHDVCEINLEEFILDEIHKIEKWYIDAKENPHARETYKRMIADLRAAYNRITDTKRAPR